MIAPRHQASVGELIHIILLITDLQNYKCWYKQWPGQFSVSYSNYKLTVVWFDGVRKMYQLMKNVSVICKIVDFESDLAVDQKQTGLHLLCSTVL